MGDIQLDGIIEGFGWMKGPKIHYLWVTKWAIIAEDCSHALNRDVGGH